MRDLTVSNMDSNSTVQINNNNNNNNKNKNENRKEEKEWTTKKKTNKIFILHNKENDEERIKL